MSRVFRAEDYHLSHLSQCDGKHGVCPDERIGGRNDVTVGAYSIYSSSKKENRNRFPNKSSKADKRK